MGQGPSITSANIDSMIACCRWVMSAAVTGAVLLVKNGWYRHYALALVMALWLADRGLGFGFVTLWAA